MRPALQARHVRVEGFGPMRAFALMRSRTGGRSAMRCSTGLRYRSRRARPVSAGPLCRGRGASPGCGAGADGGRGAGVPGRRRLLRVLERAAQDRAGLAFYHAIGALEEPVLTLSLQPDALRRLAEESGPTVE